MYKKDRYTINCANCGKKHKTGDSRVKYCSIGCYNKKTKTKDVDGYKKCEVCQTDIPFRNSLKVRSYKNIGSTKTRFCSKQCQMYWRNKIANPCKREDVKDKLRAKARNRDVSHLHTEQANEKRRKSISGDKHWNWQGGKTTENKKRRNSYETKVWRKAVFERDSYTCQICNRKSVYLEADHILPWATHLDKRWDVKNGRTLCRDCHRKTDTYGARASQLK